MVLISKLFSSPASRQSNSTSSLFGKLRSNICRNASNSCLVKFSAVEAFDGESSCRESDSPVGKKHMSPAWLHPEDEAVNLSDLDYKRSPKNLDTITHSRRWVRTPRPSGSHCDDEPDRLSHEELGQNEVEIVSRTIVSRTRSQTRPYCPAIKIEAAIQIESCGQDGTGTPLDDVRLIDVDGLPGGLWEQSDTPPQVQPAWGCSKDASVPGSRTRFPACLPPLSGTGFKSLRLLGSKTDSSPVVEIFDFPESSLPLALSEH